MQDGNNSFFRQLKEEHDTVKDLFQRGLDAEENEREGILEQIKKHLVPHARAEEKTLYAALLEANAGDGLMDLIQDAYSEHKKADSLLEKLTAATGDDDRWTEAMSALKDEVEHHIKEEENKVFEKAGKMISPALAEEMLQAYKAEKSRFEENEPTQTEIDSRKKSDKLTEVHL